MGKYFGTDGFRGEANVNLTVDHAFKVGRYLGYYYGKDHRARIVIGKDTRRSSYMFEYALCTGLMASGADAYIMHVTTTPSVSYIARVDDFDCGIMISASHNPFYDNGIKIVNNNGEKMDEETLLEIEKYIDGELEVPLARREDIGRTVDYVAGRNRYIGYLISLSRFSFKDVKVGLDVANGAAWSIAKGVYDALGAKTYVLTQNREVTVKTVKLHTRKAYLSVDGNSVYDLKSEDILRVRRSGHCIYLVDFAERSFFETVAEKLQ